jgi:hypothetical protein
VLHNASTRDVDALNEESARMMMTMMMTCEEDKQSSFQKVPNSLFSIVFSTILYTH